MARWSPRPDTHVGLHAWLVAERQRLFDDMRDRLGDPTVRPLDKHPDAAPIAVAAWQLPDEVRGKLAPYTTVIVTAADEVTTVDDTPPALRSVE